jgi:anti-repressor protein
MEQNFDYNALPVRVITDDNNNEPWFAGVDICNILGYSDPTQAIDKLDDDEKKLNRVRYGSGQSRKTWTVNEFGLYSLILSSTKPEAKAFKRWITHDVLPAIRKAGRYSTDNLSQKESKIQELINLIDKKEQLLNNSKSDVKKLESEIRNLNIQLKEVLKSDPNQLTLPFKNA